MIAPEIRAIAARYGGEVSGDQALIPTPGHSSRDRGTAIRLVAGAPDGLLVICRNGSQPEALAVKDMLRRDGFLPERGAPRRELTPAEREAIRRATEARDRAKREGEVNAARIARQTLASAFPADPGHRYISTKRIAPERLWQGRDSYGTPEALLVPMEDHRGIVWNVQSIAPGRPKAKLFIRGARTKGLFWHAGEVTGADRLVIGEGMATVAAVRRATGLPVIAAMSASNLPDVALMAHTKWPDLTLIIAADDDAKGWEAARLASARTGALIAAPGELA
ncbi:MAG: toprim domain-containing protein [Sphingomonadales bacterium]|nr:toprim domain-containing protein [Sphingomonadales bacterium]